MAVNAGEIGNLACSLCSTDGRNDLHWAPLFVLSHCLCHRAIPSFFSPVAIVLFVVFSYSTCNSTVSAAASLASLSASSLPSIPMCDFTQPKWIVQFCLVSSCTVFRISAIIGVCIEWCVYSRIYSTEYPISSAGNVSEPKLKSQVRRVHELMCTCIIVATPSTPYQCSHFIYI